MTAPSRSQTTRAKLRELLAERFVPLLFEAGFEGPSKLSGNSLLHSYRRPSGDDAHVLGIQLDKWQRPRFTVGFHVEPLEGLDEIIMHGGQVLAAQLEPRTSLFSRWSFRADRPWWDRLIRPSAPTKEHEAVARCIALFPEVEEWFATRQPSRYVSCWPVDYPGMERAGS